MQNLSNINGFNLSYHKIYTMKKLHNLLIYNVGGKMGYPINFALFLQYYYRSP